MRAHPLDGPPDGRAASLFGVPYVVALHALGVDDALMAAVIDVEGLPSLRLMRLRPQGDELLHVADGIGALSLMSGPRHVGAISPRALHLFHRATNQAAAVVPLGGVGQAGFDPRGMLWMLRGRGLYGAQAHALDQPVLVLPDALAFDAASASGVLVLTAGDEDAAWHLVALRPDARPERWWTLPAEARMPGARVDLCLSGHVVHVLVQPRFHTGRVPAAVHRFDLLRHRPLPSVRLAPIDHAGLRQLRMGAWRDGAVLLMAEEAADAMGVHLLRPEAVRLLPVGPVHGEVLDFAADATRGLLACLVTPLDQGPAAAKTGRHLVTMALEGVAWRPWARIEDVSACFGLSQGQLQHVRRAGAGIAVHALSGRAGAPLWSAPAAPSFPQPALLEVDAQGRVAPLAATVPERALLLLVPGVHKVVTAGFQPNLLQEFLYRLTARLAGEQVEVRIVQMPGGAGCGRAYRALAGPGSSEQGRFISSLVAQLRERGHGRIGLLSASLGALHVVGALPGLDEALACALVSPVFDPSAVGLPAALAPRHVQVPAHGEARVLIVHGARDEVAPYEHALRFIGASPGHRRRLVALEGEGHIFRAPASWQRTADEISRFFLDALCPGHAAGGAALATPA